jgi:hypothetical protein
MNMKAMSLFIKAMLPAAGFIHYIPAPPKACRYCTGLA